MPQGMGDREVAQPTKIKDGLEPIIMSLDLLNESVDTIVSEVSDSDVDNLTVADLDKLFHKYFSKQAIADSVTLSLSRASPPAVDSSLMVRQQLKANEVIKKQPPGKFEDVFSKQSTSKTSGGKSGEGFEEKYNKVMDLAYTATHNPLKLLDKIVPALFGGKGKDDEKSKSKSKEKESFYGQGDVEEGAFYGSFGGGATKTITSGMVDADNGRPLGTATDPLYFINVMEAELATSSVDDIQEEAAKVGMNADKALEDTLENPEQSAFANFVGGGGDGGKGGKKKGAGDNKDPGLGMVLIAGMILAALIVFKDVIEKVFDRVIIPLGELLIDFLTVLKEPLIELISAIISVVVVVLGVIKDILVAIAPYLVEIAKIVVEVVAVVLGVVRDILIELKPYLIQMAGAIAGTVVAVLNIIRGILETLKEPLIEISRLLGQIAVTLVGAVLELVKIITWPLKIVGRVLDTIEPHIIRMANFIGGVIADWFEENQDTIKKLVTELANLAIQLTKFTTDFLKGFDAAELGRQVSLGVSKGLSIMNNVLGRLEHFTSAFGPIIDNIADTVAPVLEVFTGAFASGAEGVADWLDKKLSNLAFYKNKEEREANRKAKTQAEENKFAEERAKKDLGISDLSDKLMVGMDTSSEKSILEGIWKDTTLIAGIMSEKDYAIVDILQKRHKTDDLILSSDGQVYETAPDDSVLAIKNGAVSMSPSNPISSVSAGTPVAQGSQGGGSTSTVTNVYNQSSILDSAGVSPFSQFSPVGVA
jgi:phage-related protein